MAVGKECKRRRNTQASRDICPVSHPGDVTSSVIPASWQAGVEADMVRVVGKSQAEHTRDNPSGVQKLSAADAGELRGKSI